MKRTISNSGVRIVALLFMMLTNGYAFAQTSLGDPSRYNDKNTPPKHVLLQFLGLGILLILIIYVGYRYWRNKRMLPK